MTIGRLISKLEKYPHQDKVIILSEYNLYEIENIDIMDKIPEFNFQKDVIQIICNIYPIESNQEKAIE